MRKRMKLIDLLDTIQNWELMSIYSISDEDVIMETNTCIRALRTLGAYHEYGVDDLIAVPDDKYGAKFLIRIIEED